MEKRQKISAKVICRHRADCAHRAEGLTFKNCECPKSLLTYDGQARNARGKKVNKIITAGTESWADAETFRKTWLDSFDPRLQKLARLEAKEEQKEQSDETAVEKAVGLYEKKLRLRNLAPGTMANIRVVLGLVNPDTFQVERPGKLFTYIDTLVPRPRFLREIDALDWASKWIGMDSTRAQYFEIACQFFDYAVDKKWIDESPLKNEGGPIVKKGYRTTTFSDKQYQAILDAINSYEPKNAPALTKKHWRQRLLSIVQLMRWSGCDLVDAIQFRPAAVDADGVFTYRRKKSGVQAIIPLPADVAALLRNIPLEKNSTDTEQPFRRKGVKLLSDCVTWSQRVADVFVRAGIKSVHTEIRERAPHIKMFRDSFAVWYLENGTNLFTVSQMLGHTNTVITQKHYAPHVKELQQAHLDDARKTLAKLPRKRTGRKAVSMAR